MALSATEAALEGFRLIGRRPVSVLAWALVWTLLAYGPLAWLIYLNGPGLAQTVSQTVNGFRMDRGHPWAAMMGVFRMQMTFLQLLGPWVIWAWLLHVVFRAAVYRSVLEPQKNAFAYLRVGEDELRLLLLQVVYVFIWIAIFAVAIAACVALVMAARSLQPPAQALVDGLGVVAMVVLLIYVALRLSLAAPMTFAEKRIRIFDSWGLTASHVLQMLGVALLAVIFAGVVAWIGAAIRNVILYGAMGDISGNLARAMPTAASARFAVDPRFIADLARLVGPALIAFIAIQVVIETLVRALATAPFAAAYRELAHRD